MIYTNKKRNTTMKKDKQYLIQVASNGIDVMSLLQKEYEHNVELRPFFSLLFAEASAAIDYVNPDRTVIDGGFEFEKWIKAKSPYSEADKFMSYNNLTLVLIYHMVTMKKMQLQGVDVQAMARQCSAIVGHSVGLVSGIVFALGASDQKFDELAKSAIRYMVCITYRTRKHFGTRSNQMGGSSDARLSMMSIRNHCVTHLQNRVNNYNANANSDNQKLYLGLVNSDDMAVICGCEPSLKAIREQLLTAGKISPADITDLEASEPYHSPWLAGVASGLEQDYPFIGFDFVGEDLLCPVMSTKDGSNLQRSRLLISDFSELVCNENLDWPTTLSTVLTPNIDFVFDLGPGPLTKLFTQSFLRAHNRKIRQVSIDRKLPLELLPMHQSADSISIHSEKLSQIKSHIRRNDMKAIVFAGQGIQRKGMGSSLFDKYSEEVNQASELLGYDFRELCLNDSKNQLNNTEFTQPAIYFVNALWTKELFSELNADTIRFSAGHSLGEYNALYAAGVIDLYDGLKIVQERGRLMANCQSGAMASVIGMSEEKLQQTIATFGFDGVFVANKNTPEQIVITGDSDQIQEVGALLMVTSAKNVIPLNTSGAFHSPFMQTAAEKFGTFLQDFKFNNARFKVISNVTASPHSDSEIKAQLARQIYSPVLWADSMTYLLKHNIDEIAEIGESEILIKMFNATRTHFNQSTAEPYAMPEAKVA